MLNALRRNASSWMIKVVLMLIVLVFIFWGGYSYQSGKATRLAKIDDQYISVEEYNRAYENLLDMYRERLGAAFNEEFIKNLGLKQQAFEVLVNNYLLAKGAGNLGLTPTKGEIQQRILEIKAFQEDGRFNKDRYMALLRNNRMSPSEFESMMAEDLRRQKVEQYIRGNALVTDEEVRNRFLLNYGERRLAYARIMPEEFEAEVTPDEEAIASHFEENKDDYRTAEKRWFSYAVVKPEAFVDSITVDEAEVRAYYETHQEEFRREKEVHARHILFRLDEGASEEAVAQARERAEEVLALARGGADFAELAREYSEGPSAEGGGDLGFFKKSTMVPAFAEAAFALGEGEIGGPVQTRFGFHVIKVEEIQPAETTELEQARAEIESKLKLQRARDLAYEEARVLSDVAYAEQNLAEAAKAQDLEIHEVGQPGLSRGESVGDLGRAPDLMKEVFELSEGEIGRPVETPSGYVVIQLGGVTPPEVPPFETVRDRAEGDVKRQMARKLAEEKATELLAAAGRDGLEAAASAMDIEVRTTDFFSLAQPSEQLRLRPDSALAVAELGPGKQLPDAPLEYSNGFLVCSLIEARSPSEETREEVWDRVRMEILRAKMPAVFQYWLDGVRRGTRIEMLQSL